MQSVWIFRHIACEGPGFLEVLLNQYQIPHEVFAIDEQCDIPSSAVSAAALIFLGGPMSANDDLPWIEKELGLIRQAHSLNIPILGQCLGAQLISKALGASVYPNNTKEIGWLPVQRIDHNSDTNWFADLPEEFEVFQWHGETFDLPDAAIPLFQSKYCKNQGYLLGHTLALQFHCEVTESMVKQWIECYAEKIKVATESIQSAEQMLQQSLSRCDAMHRIAEILYRQWLLSINRQC